MSNITNALRSHAIYNRLRQSVTDIRETGRISAVESRALLEMIYDLAESYKKEGECPAVEAPVTLLKRGPEGRWIVDEERTKLANAREQEIGRLQQGIANRDSEIMKLVEQITDQSAEIERLRQALASADPSIPPNEAQKTLAIVQHILGAAPTRESIIGFLDQLKSNLTQLKLEDEQNNPKQQS